MTIMDRCSAILSPTLRQNFNHHYSSATSKELDYINLRPSHRVFVLEVKPPLSDQRNNSKSRLANHLTLGTLLLTPSSMAFLIIEASPSHEIRPL
jgi:hypothetical protein